MKISSQIQSGIERNQKQISVEERKNFQRLLNEKAQHIKETKLEQRILAIEEQGSKLARYRTFRELAKFKRMVKDFLQEAVQAGYDLEETSSFSLDGNHRKLTIVEQIDEKLVQLTEKVMDEEEETIALLGLIGEVKGLLMNIYL